MSDDTPPPPTPEPPAGGDDTTTKRSRPSGRFAAAAAVLGVAVVMAGVLTVRASSAAAPKTRTVTFAVLGASDDVTVTYINGLAAKQRSHLVAVDVPEVTMKAKSGTKVGVIVRNWSENGNARCWAHVAGIDGAKRDDAPEYGDEAICGYNKLP